MASLVVLERHLWLTLTEIKDADRVSFLDAPISPSALFGPAVEGFAERFTEAQKASQAMRHFLPKRSSPAAAQSRPRTAPTQQPAKPAPAVSAPQPARTQQPRGRSRSARRHPAPKRQGPRPKIALDPAPPASSWSAGQEEERVESRHGRTAHQKASHEKPLCTPFSSGCRGNCVCCYRVRTSALATVRCDSGKNKTQTFSKKKKSNFPLPSLTSALPPCSRPLEFIQPLATRAEAWQAIPGVSEWVMGIIKRGYSLQFARRPPRFSGVVSTSVHGENARVLRSKRSHRNGSSSFERVRLLQPLLPRPQKGWRPPAHPRSQTPESRPHETAVQDDHAEADPLADSHRGLVLFSGSERCILSHPDSPHHRRFLRFAFEGVAYQYTVLPFGLPLAPRTFTKCMDAALSPLRQMGIRILNYLDDWLILAQSEVELLSHRTLILSHLERLGLRVNFAKSALSPSQWVSFLGTVLDSARMRAVIAPERALAIQKLAATFKSEHRSPTQSVSENAGPHGRSIASVTAGPAPHAPPSTLVETTGSTQRMASWMPAYQGESGLCNSPDPLEEPTVDGEGRGHGVGPHQESCHDRRLPRRLGGAVRRQTDLRPLVEGGEGLPHQLLGNVSSLSSLPVFPAGPNRTPCADSLRQHVRGVLYKSPGRCLLERLFILAERLWNGLSSTCARWGQHTCRQTEPRSGYVISEQCPLRGVDAPSAGGSEDLKDLWQGRSRPFRLQRQLSLPNLLFEGQGRVGPRLAQPPPLCIPPDRSASTGRQACQGTGSQGVIGGRLVEEPSLVVRADSATDSSPLARAPETGSPLSGERNNMAPSTRAVGSLHLAAQREPTGLPERVLNTILRLEPRLRDAATPLSGLFSPLGASNRGENPSTSELVVVCPFCRNC